MYNLCIFVEFCEEFLSGGLNEQEGFCSFQFPVREKETHKQLTSDYKTSVVLFFFVSFFCYQDLNNSESRLKFST